MGRRPKTRFQLAQGLGEVCLDRLVSTTYVANVDEPTLSIIVPVLMRGLRVRGNANVVRSAPPATACACTTGRAVAPH